MRVLTAFYGCNRAFREWLAAGMPANVICLEEHRQRKRPSWERRPTERKPLKLLPQVYQMGLLEASEEDEP